MKKTLFMETTEVPVQKSIGEIMGLLSQFGAVAINQELKGGRIVGLSFVIPIGAGRLPFELPVRIEPVFHKLQSNRTYEKPSAEARDREQAEKIAWRQLAWWLKAQLALIDLGMVEAAEVLLPYRLGANGRSFFDTYRSKLLAAPGTEGADV